MILPQIDFLTRGEININYGGFLRRLGANIIDGIIVNICVGLISFFIKQIYMYYQLYGVSYPNDSISNIFVLWYFIGYWIIALPYEVFFLASSFQATPGKLFLSMQVVNYDGHRISYLRSFTRFLASFISAVSVIGYLMVAFTKKKQALHDIMAGTLVIISPKSDISQRGEVQKVKDS